MIVTISSVNLKYNKEKTQTMAQIKSLIEKATAESLPSEDWDSNLSICDLLMQKPDDLYVEHVCFVTTNRTPIAVQTLLTRLSGSSKVQLYTLTVYIFCIFSPVSYLMRV